MMGSPITKLFKLLQVSAADFEYLSSSLFVNVMHLFFKMSSMVWIYPPCAALTMSVPRSFGRRRTSTTRTAIPIHRVRGCNISTVIFLSYPSRSLIFRELVISGEKVNVLNARIEVIRELEY